MSAADPKAPGGPEPTESPVVPRWLDRAFGLSAVALALLVGIALQREVARPVVSGQRVLPGLSAVDRCGNESERVIKSL